MEISEKLSTQPGSSGKLPEIRKAIASTITICSTNNSEI